MYWRIFTILSLLLLCLGTSAPSNADFLRKMLNCDDPSSPGYWVRCRNIGSGSSGGGSSRPTTAPKPSQPAPGPDTAGTSAPPGGAVRATRAFAGPGQFPPTAFAAYGIVVFRSRASEFDLDRHQIICEAYVNSIPHESEVETENKDQMVTVWPLDSDTVADEINAADRGAACDKAIENYGQVTAIENLKHARNAGWESDNQGPFLLAWSPPATRGRRDAVVLSADLSAVRTYEDAIAIMQRWTDDIEGNPDLWRSGWSLEKLRRQLQVWLDLYGSDILRVVQGAG